MDGDERAALSGHLFGLLVRLVHDADREATAALRRHGLTPAQFQTLRAVRDRPGTPQRDLAERFGVTMANVSMLLSKLEAAGLLSRSPRGAANRLHLTDAGHALVDRLEPEQSAFLADRFAGLTDGQLRRLHQLVRALRPDAGPDGHP